MKPSRQIPFHIEINKSDGFITIETAEGGMNALKRK
jgi:hypothetical protein